MSGLSSRRAVSYTHLICIGDYDKAIAAAKRVIDGTDGDYHLMTERFGTRAGEATDLSLIHI